MSETMGLRNIEVEVQDLVARMAFLAKAVGTSEVQQHCAEALRSLHSAMVSLNLASNSSEQLSPSAEPSIGKNGADTRVVLTASSYRLSEEFVDPDFRIESVKQRGGSYLWAGRLSGRCLSKSGKMIYEPQPSSRSDEFLEQCRFQSPEMIIGTLLKARESQSNPSSPFNFDQE